MENFENIDPSPIYTKEIIYPKELNLSYNVLHQYYVDDILKWCKINKKRIQEFFKTEKLSSKTFEKIIHEPYKILPKDLTQSLIKYNGKLREYSDKLSEHLTNLHNNKKHPIFGPNSDIKTIIMDLMKYNENNSETNILFEHPDYPGEKFLNSINKISSVINHWFPEIYECIIAGNKLSLIDQVRNKDLFYARIHRIVGLDKFKIRERTPDAPISRFLATYFKVTNGNQIAYNFPLPLAKWIYRTVLSKPKFDNIQDIYVLDTSLGWGGRLGGIMSSLWFGKDNKLLNNNKKYHYWGTDVNTEIKDRYAKLFKFWKENINKDIPLDIYTSTVGAEVIFNDDKFKEMKGKFHFMFTSPPYFNKEEYSEDPNQSFRKFPQYESWVEGFLKPMLKNVYELLAPGGECWINIADVKRGIVKRVIDKSTGKIYTGKIKKNEKDNYIITANKEYWPIQEATIQAGIEAGFKYNNFYRMIFGIVVGTRRADKTSLTQNEIKSITQVIKKSNCEEENIKQDYEKLYKWEPIFCFIKE